MKAAPEAGARFDDWYAPKFAQGGPVAFRKYAPGLTNRVVSAPRDW